MKLLILSVLLAACAVRAAEPVVRPDPARFAAEIAAFEKQEPERGGIVFTGSSSIRLWTGLKEDFPDLPVINRGFGGCISNDLTAFFETVVARHEPRLIVVYSGGNDLNANLGVSESFLDYTNFLTIAHERFPRARIIVNSVKIAPIRAAQIPMVMELNDRLLVWSMGKGWLRFLDSTSYLAGPDGSPLAAFYREDRLHLNAEGYAGWKILLEPVLREEWAKVR